MADLNKAIITGRLGADAVVKTTTNGKSIMEMSVAVNTGYGDYKKTIWYKLKQFGDRVNNIAPIFTKGSIVAASGELDFDEWDGKDGTHHKDPVIKCMDIQLLYKKDGEEPAVTESAGDQTEVF